MTFFEKIICVFTTQKYFNAILSGLKTTVCITFFSVCIGLVIGTGVAFVKVSQKYIRSVKWLQPICDAYIAVIRGTPLALQLFIMAFAVLAIRDFPLEITAIITFGSVHRGKSSCRHSIGRRRTDRGGAISRT